MELGAFVVGIIALVTSIWIVTRYRYGVFKSLTLGWRLLWISGLMFVPGGAIWIMKWQPSGGPYLVGEKYPFGSYVNAWEVSMGFAFIAFGILFAEASVLASKSKNKLSWLGLLMSWVLLMLPHALIGVTFVLDDPSLANLGVSATAIPFAITWFIIVVSGFVLSLTEILR